VSSQLISSVLALLESGVDLAVTGCLIALLVLHRDSVKLHWRRGLVVGLLVLGVVVPQNLTTIFYISPDRMVGDLGPQGLEDIMEGAVLAGVIVGSTVGTAMRVIWYTVLTCVVVTEWQRLRPDAPLLGQALLARVRPLSLAFGLGLLAGALSAWIFDLIQVDMGRAIELLQAYFPGLAESSVGTRVLVALPLGVYAALVEELVFRGALLGFLLRVGREQRWVVVAASVATSLAWALLHLSVTDMPLIKLTQIFLIGLGLAAIARRWGIEAAILAHLGLNLAGLAGMLVLGA